MKKKICYLILFMSIIVLPVSVKGATKQLLIECDKETYNVSDTATCMIKGESDEEIFAISAVINNASDFEITFTTDEQWQGDGEDGQIELYADLGKKDIFNIGKVTIKPKSKEPKTLELLLSEIMYSNTDGTEYTVEDSKASIIFSKSDNENQQEVEDNKNNESKPIITEDNNNKNSSVTQVKNEESKQTNPKTSDINIGLIIFVTIITSFLVLVGLKKVNKKS